MLVVSQSDTNANGHLIVARLHRYGQSYDYEFIVGNKTTITFTFSASDDSVAITKFDKLFEVHSDCYRNKSVCSVC